MSDFAAFLAELGLLPRTIAADDRWRRCATVDHPRRRNGAYKLSSDGRAGFAQNWATMSAPAVWRPDRIEAAPVLDYRAIRARNDAEAARRDRATAAAAAFYRAASRLRGGHPYLGAHGLDMTGCRGLKVDADGWLVVPMGRAGRLQSVQRISPEGEKRFWTGAPTAGAYYRIDRPAATLTVLAEGLATGLALYAAIPSARVVIAFSAANLPRVARGLPAELRRGLAVVAADNDHRTEERTGTNPGVVYATEAAAVLGCDVAIPEVEGEDTDFCDLRQQLIARATEHAAAWRQRRSALEIRRAADDAIHRAVMKHAVFLPLAALAIR